MQRKSFWNSQVELPVGKIGPLFLTYFRLQPPTPKCCHGFALYGLVNPQPQIENPWDWRWDDQNDRNHLWNELYKVNSPKVEKRKKKLFWFGDVRRSSIKHAQYSVNMKIRMNTDLERNYCVMFTQQIIKWFLQFK